MNIQSTPTEPREETTKEQSNTAGEKPGVQSEFQQPINNESSTETEIKEYAIHHSGAGRGSPIVKLECENLKGDSGEFYVDTGAKYLQLD